MYLIVWAGIIVIVYIIVFLILRRLFLMFFPNTFFRLQYFGVWAHELSHAFFAIITFHKIKEFEVNRSNYRSGPSGGVKSIPLWRDQRYLIDAILVGIGPLWVGSYGIFWSYIYYCQASEWPDYLLSILAAFIIMSAVIPSKPDIANMLIYISKSGFEIVRQFICIFTVFVFTVWIYPALYYINLSSPWPLYFLILFYGAFLLDFCLLQIIRHYSMK